RCASASRPQFYLSSGPTSHGILDRNDEQAHWTAMPSAEIGNVGRPRVRLVLVASQLHLHDDSQYLLRVTHQKQHQIGPIFSGPKIAQIRRLSTDLLVARNLYIKVTQQICCRRAAVPEQEQK